MRFRAILALAGLVAGAGQASFAEPVSNDDPYPSTYRPYPGVPTLIRNATIFDGEGHEIDGGSLLIAGGKVVALGTTVAAPADARMIDGSGLWVTPGIIDVHSHIGVWATPDLPDLEGTNELTDPVHPDVWVQHSIWPQDPTFIRTLTDGGVTSMEVLPGSGNLFGGRSVVLKNVPSPTVQGMIFPGAPQGLKMACGENPMRTYGQKGRMPSTRMGNWALDRATWIKAAAYKASWDRFATSGGKAPERDIGLDTLKGVLEGRIRVQNHCYRADDMAQALDMAKEFGYHIAAFHHGIEAYKIAPLLAANHVCVAAFADQFGFKLEAYDGLNENIALLYKAGVCVMIHSDEHNGAERLNQEVAKAVAAGGRAGIEIPDAVAWEFLSYNPAKALGIEDQTGSLRPGKMADVVLWNGNPFSVYSRPAKVWIDGALLFDASDPKLRPVSDYELGQPGWKDPK